MKTAYCDGDECYDLTTTSVHIPPCSYLEDIEDLDESDQVYLEDCGTMPRHIRVA